VGDLLACRGKGVRRPPTGEVRELIKKRKKVVDGKLSFAREGVGDDGADDGRYPSGADPTRSNIEHQNKSKDEDEVMRRKVNTQSGLSGSKVMRILFLTTNTLLSEAQQRETLWRESFALQEKIKKEKISIPLVFYDGRYCACSTF